MCVYRGLNCANAWVLFLCLDTTGAAAPAKVDARPRCFRSFRWFKSFSAGRPKRPRGRWVPAVTINFPSLPVVFCSAVSARPVRISLKVHPYPRGRPFLHCVSYKFIKSLKVYLLASRLTSCALALQFAKLTWLTTGCTIALTFLYSSMQHISNMSIKTSPSDLTAGIVLHKLVVSA